MTLVLRSTWNVYANFSKERIASILIFQSSHRRSMFSIRPLLCFLLGVYFLFEEKICWFSYRKWWEKWEKIGYNNEEWFDIITSFYSTLYSTVEIIEGLIFEISTIEVFKIHPFLLLRVLIAFFFSRRISASYFRISSLSIIIDESHSKLCTCEIIKISS